jgi:hypothetical protein
VDCIIDGNVSEQEKWEQSQVLEVRTRIRKRLEYNPEVQPNTQSTNKNKSGSCFIATATMGSYDHPEVMELRNFRENWILEKKWGAGFVDWYYHYGSIAAK